MLSIILRGMLLFFLSFSTSILADNNNKFIIYSYHQAPPFITGEKTGLTYDFAKYLSRKHKNLNIEVLVLPRKRLDRILSVSPQNIIIPWVSPKWFSSIITDQFEWSTEIMPDASIYIWKNHTPHEFYKPQDLIGFNLGGIRGYRYLNVDPLVRNRQILRSDSNNEKQLLQMLLQKRVDVGIIPFSAAQYLIQEFSYEDAFNLSSHHQFSRQLMVRSQSESMNDSLMNTVSNMKTDQSWQLIMQKYGLITHPETLKQATR